MKAEAPASRKMEHATPQSSAFESRGSANLPALLSGVGRALSVGSGGRAGAGHLVYPETSTRAGAGHLLPRAITSKGPSTVSAPELMPVPRHPGFIV